MARNRWVVGFTRIAEPEFKAAIIAASKAEPDLPQRLRRAIVITSSCRRVDRDIRDQFLRWIAEVETAIAAMAEAETVAQSRGSR